LGELLLQIRIIRAYVVCECGQSFDAELDPKEKDMTGTGDEIDARLVREATEETERVALLILRHQQCTYVRHNNN
jgi:hypothetical protein